MGRQNSSHILEVDITPHTDFGNIIRQTLSWVELESNNPSCHPEARVAKDCNATPQGFALASPTYFVEVLVGERHDMANSVSANMCEALLEWYSKHDGLQT